MKCIFIKSLLDKFDPLYHENLIKTATFSKEMFLGTILCTSIWLNSIIVGSCKKVLLYSLLSSATNVFIRDPFRIYSILWLQNRNSSDQYWFVLLGLDLIPSRHCRRRSFMWGLNHWMVSIWMVWLMAYIEFCFILRLRIEWLSS